MSADRANSAAARATLEPGSAGRSSAVRRFAGRLIAGGLLVGLTAFHGWLLEQRIADLTLLEPLVALRWAVAALLVVGLVYLQRAGVSLVWGRRALVLWLLVLVLHAGSVPADGIDHLAEPVLLLALPLWVFALEVILGERAGAARFRPRPAPLLAALRDQPTRPPREPGLLAPLSPRAPPVRFSP